MFRFMLQKIRHKKWLVICMLIGNILLIAVAAGYPMYKNASLQRMLADEFDNYQEETGSLPAVVTFSATASKGMETVDYERVEAYAPKVFADLKIDKKEFVEIRNLSSAKGTSLLERSENAEMNLKITSLTGLEDHCKVVAGRMFAKEAAEDGVLEAVVTEACFVEKNLLLDEVFSFRSLKNPYGDPVKVKIVGVIKNSDRHDVFWIRKPDEYRHEVFIANEMFDSWFRSRMSGFSINGTWYAIGDGDSLDYKNVRECKNTLNGLLKDSKVGAKIEAEGISKVMDRFLGKEKKIEATLLVLQIPVMALLAAFLFMISGQMLSMEQNEISQLKSRGAGRGQIIRLYLMQNALLGVIALILGLPIGMGICKLLGSSTAFLEFGGGRPLHVHLTAEAFLYALIAVACSVFLTLIPVFGYSRVSIVHVKRSKVGNKKKLWQKLYLDIALTGISLYGFYSFSGQMKELKASVAGGKPLDPLLYLSASLFILGTGMLYLRIQPYLIRGLFFLLKKKLSPATYASFLQTLRTGGKQQFIMLFLVLTVSLGIFNATVARTIISNAEENTVYLAGVDLVAEEYWKNNEAYALNHPGTELVYLEPDYSKYDNIPHVTAATKVYRTVVEASAEKETGGKKQKESVTASLMAIRTKEYGEMLLGDKNLNTYHINEYLNVLSKNSDAILVSDSFRKHFGKKIGDEITYTNDEGKSVVGIIYGFFTYWTDFLPQQLVGEGEETRLEDSYMIVAHLSKVFEAFDVRPYQVWMKTDGTDASFFETWAKENGYEYTRVVSLTDRLEEIRMDTLFQGTNGILTLSFIIILLLCGVGYLIYWILSIRERELLFGILRAMGMRKNEILTMLFTEQLFCGVLSIVFGGIVGVLSSRLFVPLIQVTYAADDQVLPLRLITDRADAFKLFGVIAVMLLVCVIVLIRNIASMKIANALKLGED